MLLRLLAISLLPLLAAGQEFQCGTDKIQSDIAKTVVQINCKDKVAEINKCCGAHDGCYDQQQPRTTCDASFCACVAAASAGNPLCGFYTTIFCDTTKVFGEAAYKKAGAAIAKEGGAKQGDAASAAAAAPVARAAPKAVAQPGAYQPVPPGQTAADAVARAEAALLAQASRRHATATAKPAPSSSLLFTPFPDPMSRLRDMMTPTIRPTKAPVTPSPVEVERHHRQNLARAAFEEKLKQINGLNEQMRHRDEQLKSDAADMMRKIAERKHVYPTATPPTTADQGLNQQSSSIKKPSFDQQLSPLQEALIEAKVKAALRAATLAKPELTKIEPGKDDVFSKNEEEQKAYTELRRSPISTVAPPTTTVASILHQRSSSAAVRSTPAEDPAASIFHPKDPMPINEFLKDREVIDTLSSIDVSGAIGDEQQPRDGFTPVAEGSSSSSVSSSAAAAAAAAAAALGPFESALQEAQRQLKESQQRVDELIKDQRLKIEREEKERNRLLEERRLQLAERKRLLEERKKRREQKRKEHQERIARQRLIAEHATDTEWNRRMDQEAKVKALEDSTRQPEVEDDTPVTATTEKAHKKKQKTNAVAPEDEEREESTSAEATSAKAKRKHSRYAKNELDSDSYEAYEEWLRWREKRKLARRKHADDSAAE